MTRSLMKDVWEYRETAVMHFELLFLSGRNREFSPSCNPTLTFTLMFPVYCITKRGSFPSWSTFSNSLASIKIPHACRDPKTGKFVLIAGDNLDLWIRCMISLISNRISFHPSLGCFRLFRQGQHKKLCQWSWKFLLLHPQFTLNR